MTINTEIYNKNFEKIMVLDTFNSFIWTERYDDTGDFELSLNPESIAFKKICSDYYICLIRSTDIDTDERKMMIVEDIKLTYDAETGTTGIMSGRSLESLLDRRIIWRPTMYCGSLQDGIKLLLENNIINPDNENRKIENFEFEESTNEDILSLGIEINKIGDSLLKTITDICQPYQIGFEIVYNFVKEKFIFRLYKGENRSNNNPKDHLVIEFSKKNENLLNSNFVNSATEYRNAVLISGEGEEDKKYLTSYNNISHGINRKEMYVESNLSYNLDDYEKLSIGEYERQLKNLGKIELKKVEKVTSFEGEVSASHDEDIFKYKKDFFLGDIVFVNNEYNLNSSAIVTEIVECYDENGRSFLPTFVSIEKKPTEIVGTIYIDNDNKIFEIKDIPYPITIDWGDGNIEIGVSGTISHNYEGKEGDYEGLYDFKFHRTDNFDINFCPKFTESKVLYEIEVPNGVKTLEEKTFYNCTILHSVVLPDSLETLNGEQMFYNCSNIFTMVLPNSIKELHSNTFQNCTNLISCNVPFNLKNVPTNFLNNCPKIKSIIFPGNTYSNVGVETISENALNNCPKIRDVTFGSMVKNINGNFLNGPSSEDSVKIVSLNYEPPTLSPNFSPYKISSIEVPNSPKFDDKVLNDYKAKWGAYSNLIKEKDGKPIESEQESEHSYAKNSSRSGTSSGGSKDRYADMYFDSDGNLQTYESSGDANDL